MVMPPVTVGQELEVTVEKVVATGQALCRHESFVLFVRGLVPGDRALVRVRRIYSGYALAELVQLLKASIERVASGCEKFGVCGGCQWLDLPEEHQPEILRRLAEDALHRVRRGTSFPILGPFSSQNRLAYRRRARFRWAAKSGLGFLARESHLVIHLDRCPILAPEIDGLLAPLNDALQGLDGLAEIEVVAGSGKTVLALRSSRRLEIQPEDLLKRLEPHGVSGIVLEDGTGGFTGKTNVLVLVPPFTYELPVGCFFQSNANLTGLLRDRVCEAVMPKGDAPDASPVGTAERILELHAGVGLFTLPLAERSPGQITAVERDGRTCRALVRNLRRHGLRAKVVNLPANQLERRGKTRPKPTTILVDPPRAGLEPRTRRLILRLAPKRLVYVSCDPATLARDLEIFQTVYEIVRVELFDLFPQTAHVEILAVLRLGKTRSQRRRTRSRHHGRHGGEAPTRRKS